MAIAGQRESRVIRSRLVRAAGQSVAIGLLLSIACTLPASGQSNARLRQIDQAKAELDNGNYSRAINLAKIVIKKTDRSDLTFSALDIILLSQIARQEYEDAETTLESCLELLSKGELNEQQKGEAYLRSSDLLRAERKFPEALKAARKAVEAAPNNPDVLAGYYLSLGRIMFSSGYDLAAIIWLEKAEQLFESRSASAAQLDTYRFLSLAWSSKLNYPAALRYSEKLTTAAAGSRFKYKYRQALFEAATLLSSTGQDRKALAARGKGLRLSLDHNNSYQARNFLASLLLSSLYDGDASKASIYLEQLTALDADKQFQFEATLGTAVISALAGQQAASEKAFDELGKIENTSPFILPSWKTTIAERNKQWEQVIQHNTTLLELTLAENFREDLPRIYLTFAAAHFHLDQLEKSIEHLRKALALIEEIRSSENKNLSLALLEIYHSAYRLMAQTKLERPLEAFELSDYLKARVLKDKIDNSATNSKSDIAPDLRRKLEALTLQLIDTPGVALEIRGLEESFTSSVPELTLRKPDLSGLDQIPYLEDKAIVSYFFTHDERLLAFVWERDRPIRAVYLPVSEREIEDEARRTEQKIKDLIFFKRDGERLFDKLLKPLGVTAKHLTIVPDKHLWKIPFQALSPDGKKYLVEDAVISYAPSVAVLVDQLKTPKPVRRTLQAFANRSYNNQLLRHVNGEAISIAALFGSKPVLDATVSDFRRLSDKADILHLSMHAQVDNDQPLESFLAFKGSGNGRGRLTVDDLLKTRLKKGSLVFLASCDTTNVFSGEGLVSLAWGMMGSGATTVISAQWEADDRFTGQFTGSFYRHHLQGVSSARALREVSLEMIRNKSGSVHEPYFWANFAVLGDFR